MGQLNAVGIAHHVVMKDDAAHASQLHAARLQRAAAADFEPFGPGHDLLLDRFRLIVEPAVGPVTMWTKHAGELARLALGPIQATGDVMPGETFQIHAFDRVIVAIDQAVDDGVGGRFGWHRPQAQAHQHLPANFLGSLGPVFFRLGWRERKVAVQVHQRAQAPILRLLAGRQDSQCFALRRTPREQQRKQQTPKRRAGRAVVRHGRGLLGREGWEGRFTRQRTPT